MYPEIHPKHSIIQFKFERGLISKKKDKEYVIICDDDELDFLSNYLKIRIVVCSCEDHTITNYGIDNDIHNNAVIIIKNKNADFIAVNHLYSYEKICLFDLNKIFNTGPCKALYGDLAGRDLRVNDEARILNNTFTRNEKNQVETREDWIEKIKIISERYGLSIYLWNRDPSDGYVYLSIANSDELKKEYHHILLMDGILCNLENKNNKKIGKGTDHIIIKQSEVDISEFDRYYQISNNTGKNTFFEMKLKRKELFDNLIKTNLNSIRNGRGGNIDFYNTLSREFDKDVDNMSSLYIVILYYAFEKNINITIFSSTTNSNKYMKTTLQNINGDSKLPIIEESLLIDDTKEYKFYKFEEKVLSVSNVQNVTKLQNVEQKSSIKRISKGEFDNQYKVTDSFEGFSEFIKTYGINNISNNKFEEDSREEHILDQYFNAIIFIPIIDIAFKTVVIVIKIISTNYDNPLVMMYMDDDNKLCFKKVVTRNDDTININTISKEGMFKEVDKDYYRKNYDNASSEIKLAKWFHNVLGINDEKTPIIEQLDGSLIKNHKYYDVHKKCSEIGVTGVGRIIAYLMTTNFVDTPTLIILFQMNSDEYIIRLENERSTKESVTFVVFEQYETYALLSEKTNKEKEGESKDESESKKESEADGALTGCVREQDGRMSENKLNNQFKIHDNDSGGSCLFYVLSAGLLHIMLRGNKKLLEKLTIFTPMNQRRIEINNKNVTNIESAIKYACIRNDNVEKKQDALNKLNSSVGGVVSENIKECLAHAIGYHSLRETISKFYGRKEFKEHPYFENDKHLTFRDARLGKTEYIETMSRYETFGDTSEICVFSFLYNVKVVVYNKVSNGFLVSHVGSEINNEVGTIHIYKEGDHFQFLEPRLSIKGGSIIKLRKTKQNKKRLNKRKTKRHT